MSTKITGKDLILILGSTTVVANDVIKVSARFEGKKSDSTGMGDDWDTFLTDLQKGGGFTINGFDSGTIAAESTSLRKAIEDIWIQDDHQDTFAIRPVGSGSGLRTITGTAVLDDWNPEWDKSEFAPITATFTFNSAATITVQ